MGGNEDRISRSLKIYQCLLRLFPADFRDAYVGLMRQAFCDQLRDAVSTSDRFMLWLRTILDIFANALEEHMQKKWGQVRSFVQPSPLDRPLRWLVLFCLLTLAAFYLYRKMVMTISIDLVDLLLERTALEMGSPILRILRHGYLHSVVFSLLLAGFQAFLFKNTAISSGRWFLASFLGWLAGLIAATQIWALVGPSLTGILWQTSPALLARADIILETLVFGLLIGVAQLWAVWKRLRLYGLWPLVMVASISLHQLALYNLYARSEMLIQLIFIPYLISGLLTGLALVLLLPSEVTSEREAGPAPTSTRKIP